MPRDVKAGGGTAKPHRFVTRPFHRVACIQYVIVAQPSERLDARQWQVMRGLARALLYVGRGYGLRAMRLAGPRWQGIPMGDSGSHEFGTVARRSGTSIGARPSGPPPQAS